MSIIKELSFYRWPRVVGSGPYPFKACLQWAEGREAEPMRYRYNLASHVKGDCYTSEYTIWSGLTQMHLLTCFKIMLIFKRRRAFIRNINTRKISQNNSHQCFTLPFNTQDIPRQRAQQEPIHSMRDMRDSQHKITVPISVPAYL